MTRTLLQRNEVSLTVDSLEDRQMMSATPMAWAAAIPNAVQSSQVAAPTSSPIRVEMNISAATDAYSVAARGVCATPMLTQASAFRMEPFVQSTRPTQPANLQPAAVAKPIIHDADPIMFARMGGGGSFTFVRLSDLKANPSLWNDKTLRPIMNCMPNLSDAKNVQQARRDTVIGAAQQTYDFKAIAQARDVAVNHAVPTNIYGQQPAWAK